MYKKQKVAKIPCFNLELNSYRSSSTHSVRRVNFFCKKHLILHFALNIETFFWCFVLTTNRPYSINNNLTRDMAC